MIPGYIKNCPLTNNRLLLIQDTDNVRIVLSGAVRRSAAHKQFCFLPP